MLKKILKRTLIALAILIVLFVVVVALQPADYRVTRSAIILVAPDVVFPHVNDLHNWDAWSPWAKLDPRCKVSFEGATEGTGAVFNWSGNSEVGEGRMTITESRPGEMVRIKLDFLKPFACTADAEFTFKPAGKGTRVTWSMSGKNNFIGRAMCLIMNMDRMLGDQFEQGLTQIKTVVETANKK